MRRLFALAALGTALYSTSALATTATITLTQELSGIDDLSKNYKYTTTDAAYLTEIFSPLSGNEFEKASKAAIAAPTSNVFYYLDGSNYVTALSFVGNAWRTFKGATGSLPLSATGNFDLTETTTDGNAAGGSPYVLRLAFTKTTGANIDATALINFLRASTVSTLAAAGQALTGAPTGWTVSATMRNGAGTGVAATLDPVECDETLTWTLASGSTVALTARLLGLDTFNLATNSTTKKSVIFMGSGRYMKFDVLPGKFVRTASIATGVATAINALPSRILQSSGQFLNTLPSAISEVRTRCFTSPTGDTVRELTTIVENMIKSDNYVVGKFATTFNTNKGGIVAFTSANITNITWSSDDRTLVATGTVGTAPAKQFKLNCTGITTMRAGDAAATPAVVAANPVLTFRADDGDAFWVKTFDTTDIDTSSATGIDATDQDTQFALQLKDLIDGITTIPARKLHQFTADLS